MATQPKTVRGGERTPVHKLTLHAKKGSKVPDKKKEVVTRLKRLYVLDTNVLMTDPACIYHFKEHDIFIPGMVLEELDNHKKDITEVGRHVRAVSRTLDEIFPENTTVTALGAKLAIHSGGIATGNIFLQTEEVVASVGAEKPDNVILAVVLSLVKKHQGTHDVVLVSKDINMRLKARTMGIYSADYTTDRVVNDIDLLPPGAYQLPANFWSTHQITEFGKDERTKIYKVSGPLFEKLYPNEFVYVKSGKGLDARVVKKEGNQFELRSVIDYTHASHAVSGVQARNREQNYVLNLLMDPNVDLVILVGVAGSGKTLLTLAAGIAQTVETNRYSEIIITRATVSVGEDIGFLPGNEEEKMAPWMGALDDNLDFLTQIPLEQSQKSPLSHHKAKLGELQEKAKNGMRTRAELIRSRIKVKSMSFMRGRTFLDKYIIIDEAQNLTPKQMKTLITRAGPGTKIVCMGNLAQIDTPYLSEGSSGLTYATWKFGDWEYSGHIILPTGERSRLANHANKVM